MREIGTDEDQVPIVIRAHVVADEPVAPAVQCERELEFRVMVPLEWNAAAQTPVEKGNR